MITISFQSFHSKYILSAHNYCNLIVTDHSSLDRSLVDLTATTHATSNKLNISYIRTFNLKYKKMK